jgi:hypothetical protein
LRMYRSTELYMSAAQEHTTAANTRLNDCRCQQANQPLSVGQRIRGCRSPSERGYVGLETAALSALVPRRCGLGHLTNGALLGYSVYRASWASASSLAR